MNTNVKSSEMITVDALAIQLLHCCADLTQWRAVVELLMVSTGASKGLFTRRNNDTGHLSMTGRLPVSPFNVGFEPEYAQSYLAEFYKHDIWCDIQAKMPPIEPMIMSEHLPFDELKASPFWQWLEPQKITDSIVVNVGDIFGGWIALSLYFSNPSDQKLVAACDLLSSHLPILKEAVKLSVHAHVERIEKEQLQKLFLADGSAPIAIVKSNGRALYWSQSLNDVVDNKSYISQPSLKSLQDKYDTQVLSLTHSDLGEKTDFLVFREEQKEIQKELSVTSEILSYAQRVILDVLQAGGTLLDCEKETGMHINSIRYHWDKLKSQYALERPSDLKGAKIYYK